MPASILWSLTRSAASFRALVMDTGWITQGESFIWSDISASYSILFWLISIFLPIPSFVLSCITLSFHNHRKLSLFQSMQGFASGTSKARKPYYIWLPWQTDCPKHTNQNIQNTAKCKMAKNCFYLGEKEPTKSKNLNAYSMSMIPVYWWATFILNVLLITIKKFKFSLPFQGTTGEMLFCRIQQENYLQKQISPKCSFYHSCTIILLLFLICIREIIYKRLLPPNGCNIPQGIKHSKEY